MASLIKGYEPSAFFGFFEEISAIPRSSGNEKAIASYLETFAKLRGLYFYRDEIHNVIIKKSGSLGKEKLPPIILQGHTDMVCEKNSDTLHDFAKEGLKLCVEKGFLSAKGTTLGADNGVAVALMLTLLDSQKLVHPPLECVFTVQEESGLAGVLHLDGEKLLGRTMINLDSEEEGVATVSCAGGMRVQLFKDAQWENTEGMGITLQIRGLAGGHSGVDIDKGRANANKLMGRLLVYLAEERIQYVLCELNGGNKDNAIPRECDCTIQLRNSADRDKVIQMLNESADEIKRELSKSDPAFNLLLTDTAVTRTMSSATSFALCSLLFLVPDGVRMRDTSKSDFIITSCNMGVAKTANNGVTVTFSVRSSIESQKRLIKSELALFAGRLGFAMQVNSAYPGWEYAESSRIREIFSECYAAQAGKPLKIEAIHAGLECGLFIKKLGTIDSIAVGPTITGCHTPEEKLDLASCSRFYKLIVSVLQRLAD